MCAELDLSIVSRTNGVSSELVNFSGRTALKISMPSCSYQVMGRDRLTDRALMAWAPMDFHNGSIEIDIASELASDAPAFARGFAGLAFRIASTARFECVYLRPANGRSDDQVRRNHAIQYFSYPHFDFARLRAESPEKYEAYVDLELGKWHRVKVDIKGDRMSAYIDGVRQPSLIVSDLKHGSDLRGGLGFWIETGTVAYFSGLRVKTQDGEILVSVDSRLFSLN
jgi:hypothetical protein